MVLNKKFLKTFGSYYNKWIFSDIEGLSRGIKMIKSFNIVQAT